MYAWLHALLLAPSGPWSLRAWLVVVLDVLLSRAYASTPRVPQPRLDASRASRREPPALSPPVGDADDTHPSQSAASRVTPQPAAAATTTSNGNSDNDDGAVAVVTGGNGGIGRETVRALARAGVHVVLACRSAERGADAVDEILSSEAQRRAPLGECGHKALTPPRSASRAAAAASMRVLPLDLGSLASVRAFAARFTARYRRLDYLVLNAGVMAASWHERTRDGFEMHFGVNHLAHHLLTNLLDAPLRAAGGRVVVVGSITMLLTERAQLEAFMNDAARSLAGASAATTATEDSLDKACVGVPGAWSERASPGGVDTDADRRAVPGSESTHGRGQRARANDTSTDHAGGGETDHGATGSNAAGAQAAAAAAARILTPAGNARQAAANTTAPASNARQAAAGASTSTARRAQSEVASGAASRALRRNPFLVYAVSKACNYVFACELARRGIDVVCVHPGDVKTGVVRNLPPLVQALYRLFADVFLLTTEQGAAASVDACFRPGDPATLLLARAGRKQILPPAWLRSAATGSALWELSERCCAQR